MQSSRNAVCTNAGAVPTSLLEKYGSVEEIDAEKEDRRNTYYRRYLQYKADAEINKKTSDYLADRKHISSEIRAKKLKDLDAAEQLVEKLKEELETLDEGDEKLEEQIGGKAEQWQDDLEAIRKWEAFFALEHDDIPS